MPEIKRRQINPSPEIDYAEIHIPDDGNLGTGSFMNVTKPGVLSSDKAISSIMVKPPVFQISANFNPSTKEITVILGFADGSYPISIKTYLFPENLNVADPHKFEVTFNNWDVTGLSMDRIVLELKESLSAGIATEGLLPPGSPLPEHVGTLILAGPVPNLPQEIREKILDDIFDLSKYLTFYQIKQGNTEIHIYRNTDFQFVYRHYNPTFGEREIRIDCADFERQGTRGFYLCVTWSAEKNSFYVNLYHKNPKFEELRTAVKLSEDKLRLIRENLEEFEEIVNSPGKEEEAHQFLKNNSIILGLTSTIEPKSKFKLGDDYITDFVIREIPDDYILIEIERPSMKLFKVTTPPERTQELNHAIEQIENWKSWIGKHHEYIRDKLEGISANPICWLIAGRRNSLTDQEKRKLTEINEQYRNNYKIFTYDDLIDRVKAVINKID